MPYDIDILGLQLGVAGYLVNSAQQLPGLDAFLIDPPPATPRRVYAGVTTYFYRFESAKQWADKRAELDAPARAQEEETPPAPEEPAQPEGEPA